jgi:nucleotide-binding universal stress UspA family protein
VPLDGSKSAEKALPHAEGLAKDGAKIYLIHVFTRHPGGGGPFVTGLEVDRAPKEAEELNRQLEESRIEQVEEYLEHIGIRLKDKGLEVETDIQEGAPHEHIVDYAKKNGIELVVMGTHGHGGFRRFLLGSTTDRVIRTGEVPVLAVP